MPHSVEAICVPPDHAGQVWPQVESLLRTAMERGGITEFADVKSRVLRGEALLWLAWDGKAIMAAVVTELTTVNGEKFCTITACGGNEHRRWIDLIEKLENHARDEGCKAIRIWGRPGWKRVLPEYRVHLEMLERTLG